MTLLVSKTDSMTLVVSISYKCPHALWVICIQCLNIILFYEYRYEDCVFLFRWLRRKRVEKRLEQQAAREHSRRLLMEGRRTRRMNDLYYPVNEIQSLRFNQPYSYRF